MSFVFLGRICGALLLGVSWVPAGEPVRELGWLANRIEEIDYFSSALGKTCAFAVVNPVGLPPRNGWPVLFLLHGHGRNHRTLLDNADTRALLLAERAVIVLPNACAGWYVDSVAEPDDRHGEAIGEVVALVEELRDVSLDRSRWGIAGWSMGGFGAMHHASTRPDRFGFVGSMIGLLDFPRIDGLPEGQRYSVPVRAFGSDPDAWPHYNPTHKVAALRHTKVVIVLASEAFDRTMNENFIKAAGRADVNVVVHSLQGGHTFSVVVEALPLILQAAARYFYSSALD